MAYTHDLLVLGGGAAGLTAAGVAANLGAKALLVERHRMGGDCTWTGCVPSKTLLKGARLVHQQRHADRYGLAPSEAPVDARGLLAHVRRVRQQVYDEADAPPVYEAMGVDVRHGRARFVDAHTVAVEADGREERVSGRYVVVATGGRPAVPPLPGLDAVPYLTSETLFELDALPARLGVVGAGPVGIEMAQAFRRLGADVTVFEHGGRVLSKEDAELTGLLRAVLEAEGVRFVFDAAVTAVARQGDGIAVTAEAGAAPRPVVVVDALLVATGRVPNVEDLGLDAAGVAFDARGVAVDDHCRTNVRHVYAAGDVTGRYQLTHMSEHMAKVAVTNALLKLPTKIDARHVPRVTFTDPELAHVGATEADLQKRGVRFETYRFPYARLDRAVTEAEPVGLIKVFAKPLSGRLLGASILGARAGELIGAYALALRHGVTLRQISDTIHPYPTFGLGVRRAADQWYARKQSAAVARLVQKVFGYRGSVNRHTPGRIV